MISERTEWKTAIYIRLSREDGDKESARPSNSVTNQRELIHAYLRTRPDWVLYKEYVDDGYSGVSFDRPSLKELFADMKSGKINCIIVKDLSRFGRNYIEAGRYIEQIFPFLGVRFIAINDHYDSGDRLNDVDGMLLPFKNLMNDAYSRDISMKVRSQIEVRYRQGDFVGSFPVYGYFRSDKDKHKLVIDQFAAQVVRDIFQWKMTGLNNQNIAERLNRMGILSPLEYKRALGWAYSTSFQLKPAAKWSAQAIGRILKNEVYIGHMVQGKESSPNYKIKKKLPKPASEWVTVMDTHEAIISKADFELVRQLLLTDTRTSPSGNDLFLFSGMVKCGHCGKNMVRKPVKYKNKTYVYFICRTHREDKEKCRSDIRIGEEKLKDCILTVLQKQMNSICVTDSLMNDIRTLSHADIMVKTAQIRLKKKQEEFVRYQSLVMGLEEDYQDGILNKDNYLFLKHSYEERMDEAFNAGKVLEQECLLPESKASFLNERIEHFVHDKSIIDINRAAVILLIKEIKVLAKNYIQICFSFQDEYEQVVKLNINEQGLLKWQEKNEVSVQKPGVSPCFRR